MPLDPDSLRQQQQNHIEELQRTFAIRVRVKYEEGAVEHKGFIGDLTQLQLVEMAIDEAVDQFVYLTTLRRKLINETAR